MEYQLINDDCLWALEGLPDNSIDMVLTDPPFGTTRSEWDVVIPFEPMWEQLNRVCSNATPILLFGVEPFASQLRVSNLRYFKYDWVWDKVKGTNFLNAKKQPLRGHETVSVFYRKQCIYNPQKTTGHPRKVSSAKSKRNSKKTEVYGDHGLTSYDSTERYPRSIQVFSSDVQSSALHSNQKPVALLEYFIRTYTEPGMSVLDFTMGSGSTGEACLRTGRKFIGIEKDPSKFNTAKERLKQVHDEIYTA